MRSTLAPILSISLLLAIAACHGSSGSSSFLPPGTTSLGFASEALSLESGILAASEFEAGNDLTGDGDGDDQVLHVVDLATGRSTVVANIVSFSNGGGFAACTVAEDREGRDLNGDGDTSDFVLHVVDGRRGTVKNLGLAVDVEAAPIQSGARIAFAVMEADQGRTDINHDGTPFGQILHVHDARRGTTTSLGISMRFGNASIEMRGSRLVALAYEHQVVDWNGDGDMGGDEVAFVHDLDAGTTENLGLAVALVFAFDGQVLATRVDEFDQSQDLNGDGDLNDRVLELVALETGTRHLLDRDAVSVRASDGLAFVVGDGNDPDFTYDARTDTFTELGDLPIRGSPHLAGPRAAFLLDEFVAGDLNDDGDDSDGVLFVFDARTRSAVNTRISVLDEFDTASGSFEFDDRRAAFLYSAVNDGFDGTWPDAVARVRDHATGAVRDVSPADRIALLDGLVVMEVLEHRLGLDVNGDLDEDDTILRVHDPVSRRTFDTNLVVMPFTLTDLEFRPVLALDGRQLVVSIPEFITERDGNGDGDFADGIVHAVRLP